MRNASTVYICKVELIHWSPQKDLAVRHRTGVLEFYVGVWIFYANRSFTHSHPHFSWTLHSELGNTVTKLPQIRLKTWEAGGWMVADARHLLKKYHRTEPPCIFSHRPWTETQNPGDYSENQANEKKLRKVNWQQRLGCLECICPRRNVFNSYWKKRPEDERAVHKLAELNFQNFEVQWKRRYLSLGLLVEKRRLSKRRESHGSSKTGTEACAGVGKTWRFLISTSKSLTSIICFCYH